MSDARREADRAAAPPGASPVTVPPRIRWHGDPDGPVQPDAGDVLCYVDRVGDAPDWFHLVHYAWRVRARRRR